MNWRRDLEGGNLILLEILKSLPSVQDRRPGFLVLFHLTVGCLVWGGPAAAAANLAEGNSRLERPGSQLGQPFEAPVFLTGHVAYGGGFQNKHGDLGYGGALIFRPGSTANILDDIFGGRTGMVVQVDYLQVPDGGDLTCADLILRRYFDNRGQEATEIRFFLGAGTGVGNIDRPEPNDVAAGDHWSILAEAGQEWFFKPRFMFYLKGQYRWLINAGRTYHTWSALLGVGLAWP